jgi:hypothetical protein
VTDTQPVTELLLELHGGGADAVDRLYPLVYDELRRIAGRAFRVTGTVVQHLDPAGGLLFEWSPFDHFDITDVDQETRSGAAVNWTHGNSLDMDADGNLLVSFRSLSEVTKIDARTGAVLWRMGGSRNQFTFPDSGPPFLRQHRVRVVKGDSCCWTTSVRRPGVGRSGIWWTRPDAPRNWPAPTSPRSD